MAEVLLFHHAQGLTAGVRSLADRLRAAGHDVHVPDLYDGRTFATLEEGVAHAEAIGFGVFVERGKAAWQGRPEDVVYLGISLGVLPAQALAQTRPGTRGAVLLHGCVPPEEFGGAWPEHVPVQIHLMEDDPVASDQDRPAAEALALESEVAELFLYPGDQHIFTDESLEAYDEKATAVVVERIQAFLDERG